MKKICLEIAFSTNFFNGPILAAFSVYFCLLNMLQLKFKFKLKKA